MQLPSDYIIIRGNLSKANRQRGICFFFYLREEKEIYRTYGRGSRFPSIFSDITLFSQKKWRNLIRIQKCSFMEDENWGLNEKDREFCKWIFGSLIRYFLYLFMHYFSLHWLYRWFWRCVVTTFRKPLG